MLSTLVMTIIGADRPGLVELVATRVAEHQGNWLESRMCRLGGQFAGLARVEVPAENAATLTRALEALSAQGLRLLVQTETQATRSTAPLGKQAQLEFVGQDQPGILKKITSVLAAHRINVEELTSECVSAPMNGSPLFQARATVLIPPGTDLHAARVNLEKIAADLMVDLKLTPQ